MAKSGDKGDKNDARSSGGDSLSGFAGRTANEQAAAQEASRGQSGRSGTSGAERGGGTVGGRGATGSQGAAGMRADAESMSSRSTMSDVGNRGLMSAAKNDATTPGMNARQAEIASMAAMGRMQEQYRGALLDTIKGPESAGRYDVAYGNRTISGFVDHPRSGRTITEGPHKGKTSTAAGAYQMIEATWDRYKSKFGLPDFSPKSQDTAAWGLASDTYRSKTGRDLDIDIRSTDPKTLAGIGKALSSSWASLPGGATPTMTDDDFVASLEANRASRFGPAPAPTGRGLMDVVSPQAFQRAQELSQPAAARTATDRPAPTPSWIDIEDRKMSPVIDVATYNPAAKRSQMPTTGIVEDVQAAVTKHFGPSYAVGVYSAQEPRGVAAVGSKRNHPGGWAIDFDVVAPNGRLDMSNPRDAAAMREVHKDLAAKGHAIGYGPGYMASGRTHAGSPPGSGVVGWGARGKGANMDRGLYTDLATAKQTGVSLPGTGPMPGQKPGPGTERTGVLSAENAAPPARQERFADVYLAGNVEPARSPYGSLPETGPVPASRPAITETDRFRDTYLGSVAATAAAPLGIDETRPAPGMGQKIAAGAIDIAGSMLPGVGMGVGLFNLGAKVMGAPTIGERIVADARSGRATGSLPSPTPGEDAGRRPVETETAAAPKQSGSFASKYLGFVDDTPRPTPSQKWGGAERYEVRQNA